mmetsp:Transcript_18173/g.34593  ORF Transcript_18173/g.34593 Transcript_18173/m.34593 type:complete len:208 (+) Transcript_18173:159-782(+)|eukprot:CAMPEP_0114238026 /NCGR_PEP_ID=MMETSP0058-20121206/7707_1 /TAXON_ID=36894 /ORGANISM="Pyramimonas parkeae, CCMP726" /LENGTH=207 /DNA_ID=CAMNT_0001350113 /DNA_START=138 /DNA_END=761 /DNA_ORIENTATION=-
MTAISGKVNWFNIAKGFGFVTRDDGEGDVFVHQSDLYAEGFRSLREGEPVEFQVETSEDGRSKAIKVTGPQGGFVQGAPRRVGNSGRGRGRRQTPSSGDGAVSGNDGPQRRAASAPRKPAREETSSQLQVVVLNLPWSATGQTLTDHFANTGNIIRADVVMDGDSGRSRGFGTILYETTEEALHAIETLNGTEIEGRIITVRMDRYG